MKPLRINRRRMLRRSVLAFGGVLVATPLLKLMAAPGRKFKIGACDWCLGPAAEPSSFQRAREIGLDGVQVSLGSADDMKLRQPAVQKQFRDAAQAAGVEIASLAIGALNEVPFKSDPRAEAWVGDSVEVMQALKVKTVLLAFFGKGDLRDDKPGIDEVVRRLKKIAPKAEKAGVCFGLESWLSADDTLRILDKVGSPAVKMYYDVCNSTVRGYDVPAEIRRLGRERICEFHMKENGRLLGEGQVKFEKVRDAILEIGYEGWMQIEGACPPQTDLVEAYRKNLAFLRKLFPGGAT
jgi:L-ribulose-5-phosphate 3-epimerase